MTSKLALLLPLISLIYLFQTLFRKKLKTYFKLPLTIMSLGILVFDVFVFLVFTVNCFEAGISNQSYNCINWIYPTLDFKLMIIVSLVLLFLAFVGLIRQWRAKVYYTMGSVVLYLGVAVRIFILFGAAEAISISKDSSNAIVFEIFSIVIVYGLVSAAIYFSIFFLGLFTAKIPLPSRE